MMAITTSNSIKVNARDWPGRGHRRGDGFMTGLRCGNLMTAKWSRRGSGKGNVFFNLVRSVKVDGLNRPWQQPREGRCGESANADSGGENGRPTFLREEQIERGKKNRQRRWFRQGCRNNRRRMHGSSGFEVNRSVREQGNDALVVGVFGVVMNVFMQRRAARQRTAEKDQRAEHQGREEARGVATDGVVTRFLHAARS